MERLNLTAPPASYSSSSRGNYFPTQKRAQLLTALLIVNAGMSLLSAFASALGLFFPEAEEADTGEPIVLVVALLQVGVAVVQFLVYVVTAVVFLMWFYRSYENLPSFGIAKREIKYSSGWAVGSFFVPLISLVVPYRAMKELWNKSVPHTSRMFGDLSPPGFFPLWWGVWLISSFANQLHLRLEFQGKIDPHTSYSFAIVIGFIDILSAVLALMVVREIEKQQTESSKLIPPDHMTAPPVPPTFESPLSSPPA
ncbi:MAG: DUF4328 domain-containing protein [Acidobacteriota bacterium]|nr:DUF4328 domain-containing protein [Acidobacteriota bacterium]